MATGPDDVRQALDKVSAASRSVRQQLETNERLMREVLELVDGGTPLFSAFESVARVPGRQDSDEAIKELYEARRQLREAAVAAVGEVRTPVEVAESFGLTPGQIAGIVAKTAAGGDRDVLDTNETCH